MADEREPETDFDEPASYVIEPETVEMHAGPNFTNVFDGLPAVAWEEMFETMARGKGVRIERIVSHGHASPKDFWYDQTQNELVIVLQGAARLRFEDEEKSRLLEPGDFVNIVAHRRHRVEWTTPQKLTVWLAVFYDGE